MRRRVAIVCGGRKYRNRAFLFQTLSSEHAHEPFTLIVHGAAAGADTFADEWAAENNVPARKRHANWRKYKNAAGPIRNEKMLVEFQPDDVISFPGGKGTANMLYFAALYGVRTLDFRDVSEAQDK